MEGIHFVTDEKGHRVAVQIDLERYGALWEDIHDQILAEQRTGDEREPYEAVRERLVKAGKL